MEPAELGTDQDLRILGMVHEKNRGLIIVVNKWDIVEKDEKTFDRLLKDLRGRIKFAPYAPIVSISALTTLRIDRLLDLVEETFERYTRTIDDETLTDWLQRTVIHTPPPLTRLHKPLIFSRAAMPSARPPTLVITVNRPSEVHFSYERHLLNRFYDEFDYTGVPVKILFKRGSR